MTRPDCLETATPMRVSGDAKSSSRRNALSGFGMQAGSTPYYDVVIALKNGKKVIAGRSVRDKREAEWLAITMKKTLGLDSTETTAARNVA